MQRDRRLARERALQILFGSDFTGCGVEEALESFWEHTAANEEVMSYANRLVCGVYLHKENLDRRINESLTSWSPERVGRVERTLLRLALYELEYVPDVPVAVTINEAIEIGKKFGDEEAVPFVHAVLDRLAKQENAAKLQP